MTTDDHSRSPDAPPRVPERPLLLDAMNALESLRGSADEVDALIEAAAQLVTCPASTKAGTDPARLARQLGHLVLVARRRSAALWEEIEATVPGLLNRYEREAG